MSKLLYLWRMKILWGQFPSSGICSVHKGGRKVCISFEDWETPYELFLLPPLCLLLIHPTLSNNQHTPELCWNKESNGGKFLWWNNIQIYYTPSGVIICLLLWKSLLLIINDFQIFLKKCNFFKISLKFSRNYTKNWGI